MIQELKMKAKKSRQPHQVKKPYKSTHKRILPTITTYNHLTHLIEPTPVIGSDVSKFTETYGLHLTEIGLMLGLNTSSLYGTKKKDTVQPANISILLRIYTALPEFISKTEHPSIQNLISKIQSIDPEFQQSMIGMLLGLERNSSFRLRREGIEQGSQTTKVLSTLINLAISENPKNWFLIKEIIEIEAKSRQIVPPEKAWTDGGWNKTINKRKKNAPAKPKQKNKIILKVAPHENNAEKTPNDDK